METVFSLVLLVALALAVAPIIALVLAVRLSARVRDLEGRLRVLEAVPPPGVRVTPAPAVAAPAPVPVAPEPAAPPPAAPAAAPTIATAPPPELPPIAPPPSPGEPAPRPAASWSRLEGLLGEKWLNRVGAVVLVIGLGLFLRYAFHNQWIGPTGRIALGLLTGTGLLLGGERLQRAAYRVPAQGLAAAGIAALYLSAYAAYGFYGLIDQVAAFAFLVLVTAVGMAVALRHDARAIATLAAIGGFLTPVILSTGQDAAVTLFTYLAVLDAGIVASAYWRRWWELGVLSFVLTQGLYAAWYQDWYAPAKLPVALGAASVFFVLFALVAPVQVAGRRLDGRLETLWQGTALLVFGAPLAYFLAARAVLYPAYATALGLLCLILATGHLLAAQWATRRALDHPYLRLFYLAIAVTFLTLAFPAQFSRHALAIAWSAEGLVLLWGAFRLEAPRLRLAACAVLALGGGRWLTMLLEQRSHAGVFALDNPALGSTLAFALACGLAALLYARRGERREAWEWSAEALCAMVALATPALFLTLELGLARALRLPPAYAHVFRVFIWTVTALPLLALARRDRTPILLGATSAVLVAVGLASLDLSAWRGLEPALRPPVLNPRFFAGLLIVATYALYGRAAAAFPIGAERRTRFALAGGAAAGLFLLFTLSAEIRLLPLSDWPYREAEDARNMGLSILWTVYAFIAMGLGIRRNVAALRFGGMGLFGLTVAKAFLVDLAGLDAVYRILSFLVLGAVLLLASFLYTRYRDRWATERRP